MTYEDKLALQIGQLVMQNFKLADLAEQLQRKLEASQTKVEALEAKQSEGTDKTPSRKRS